MAASTKANTNLLGYSFSTTNGEYIIPYNQAGNISISSVDSNSTSWIDIYPIIGIAGLAKYYLHSSPVKLLSSLQYSDFQIQLKYLVKLKFSNLKLPTQVVRLN